MKTNYIHHALLKEVLGSMQKKATMLLCIVFLIVSGCTGSETPEEEDIEPKQEDKAPKIIRQTSFEGSWDGFRPNYGGADIYRDPTAQDGDYSLRFTFPAGMESGIAPDIVYTTFPAEDELFIRFYFKLSANFQWHPITQKLIYFHCGQVDFGDTNHVLSVGHWDHAVSLVTQHNRGSEMDEQVFHRGNVSMITKNVWHKIVMRLVINKPGQHDGIAQIWLNDQLAIDQSDVMWLIAGDHGGWIDFNFTPVFGGGGPNVTQTMYLYFDNLIIQNCP